MMMQVIRHDDAGDRHDDAGDRYIDEGEKAR